MTGLSAGFSDGAPTVVDTRAKIVARAATPPTTKEEMVVIT